MSIHRQDMSPLCTKYTETYFCSPSPPQLQYYIKYIQVCKRLMLSQVALVSINHMGDIPES